MAQTNPILAALAVTMGAMLPTDSRAQSASSIKPEVFITLGSAQKVSLEYSNWNSIATLGGGVMVHFTPRWALEAEIHKTVDVPMEALAYQSQVGMGGPLGTFGSSPVMLPFTGHSGVTSATVVGANLLFFLTKTRVQPYLSFGVDHSRIDGISTTPRLITNNGVSSVDVRETAWQEPRTGLSFGGGLRIPVTSKIIIRPEVKIQSNINLARAAVSIGYRF